MACLDELGRLGDPARRLDRRRGPPELKQRELAEPRLQDVAQVARLRVAVGDLAAVGRIHRPRRDRDLRRRVHRKPPREVRGTDPRHGFPHLRRLHEPVGLLPQPHLHRVAKQPAVADRAVVARKPSREVGALHGRGHRRRHAADGHHRAPVREGLQARRRVADEVGRQRDGAQDDGLVEAHVPAILVCRASVAPNAATHAATATAGPPAAATATASSSAIVAISPPTDAPDGPPHDPQPERVARECGEGDEQRRHRGGAQVRAPVRNGRQHGRDRPPRGDGSALGLGDLRQPDDEDEQQHRGSRDRARNRAGDGERRDDVDQCPARAHQERRQHVALVPRVVEHDDRDQAEPREAGGHRRRPAATPRRSRTARPSRRSRRARTRARSAAAARAASGGRPRGRRRRWRSSPRCRTAPPRPRRPRSSTPEPRRRRAWRPRRRR